MGAWASMLVASQNLKVRQLVALAPPYGMSQTLSISVSDDVKALLSVFWSIMLNTSRNLNVPTLYMVGSRDMYAANTTKTYFNATRQNQNYVRIEGMNHNQYLNDDAASNYVDTLKVLEPKNSLSYSKFSSIKYFKMPLCDLAPATGFDFYPTISNEEAHHYI